MCRTVINSDEKANINKERDIHFEDNSNQQKPIYHHLEEDALKDRANGYPKDGLSVILFGSDVGKPV